MMSRRDRREEIQQQRSNISRFSSLIGLVVLIGTVLVGVALIFFAPPSEAVPQPEEEVKLAVEVNYPAPALTAENIQGKTETLEDYRNQVVLINVWTTWCPPCKDEIPTLVAFYNAHASEGFVIVAINGGESRQEIGNFVEQNKMTFPVWLDPNEDALHTLKNHILPSSYALDRAGNVRYVWAGAINQATLQKYILPLIQE